MATLIFAVMVFVALAVGLSIAGGSVIAVGVGVVAAGVAVYKKLKRKSDLEKENDHYSVNQELYLTPEVSPFNSPATSNHSVRESMSTPSSHNEAEFNVSRSVERRSGRCNVVNMSGTCPNLRCLVFPSFGDALPSDAAKKKSTAFLAGVGDDMKVIQRLIKEDKNKSLDEVRMMCHFQQMNVQQCKSLIEDLMKDTILDIQSKNGSKFVCATACMIFLTCKNIMFACFLHTVLIWYTGHGQKYTGNWVLRGRYLAFEEIYDLYMRYFKGRYLYIVTDCCFSGAWVVECARLLDRDGITCSHVAEQKQVYIKMFAASLPDEYANDKFYIECQGVKLHSRDGSKCIKFAEHRKLQDKEKKSSQTTLAVDFTRDNTCVLNLRDECSSNTTWSAYVQNLLDERRTNDYLI